MNSLLANARMGALAFLYDRMPDSPDWFRKLTPRQVEDLAEVMVQWQFPKETNRIVPMEEIQRRALLRAVTICHGNALAAAKALKIGKTTIYRKLRQWGYDITDQLILPQASAVRDKRSRPHHDTLSTSAKLSPNHEMSHPR